MTLRVYCRACTPATSQPLLPVLPLVMFQTSRKGLAPAELTSRAMRDKDVKARSSAFLGLKK
mgnify:CR=1 FL=1